VESGIPPPARGLSMKTGAGSIGVLVSPFLFAARVERRR
jgi:hypothetical protein